jgi:drug/metabolite transporter, DME family
MSHKTGYFLVIAAALLWAISGTASKFIFACGVSPIELVQLRAAGSAAILAILLGARNPSLLKIVAVAILLQYQAPLVVALYTFFIMREKLSSTTVVAMVCSLLGCYLVVGGYSLNILSMSTIGIASGLCSAVTFALYTVASESGMRRYSPWTVLFYALTVAAIILNIVYPPFHALGRSHSLATWWWIFFVTLFGTILPFAFYNLGIQKIRPTHASVTATLEPIAAAIISYIFLGETLQSWQIIGAIIVITAIMILQQKPSGINVN